MSVITQMARDYGPEVHPADAIFKATERLARRRADEIAERAAKEAREKAEADKLNPPSRIEPPAPRTGLGVGQNNGPARTSSTSRNANDMAAESERARQSAARFGVAVDAIKKRVDPTTNFGERAKL